jgi:hypothetical protein
VPRTVEERGKMAQMFDHDEGVVTEQKAREELQASLLSTRC